MSLQPFVPWLVAALAASVFGQFIGAHRGTPWLSMAAATLLPIAAIVVACGINRPHWQPPNRVPGAATPAIAARRNARLIAMIWGAGAASLLSVYLGSGLRWQHGWQYGAGMALTAILCFGYALRLGHGASRFNQRPWLDAAAIVVAIQALAAFAGLIFLIASGKVWSARPDWAANVLFVTGSIAIAAVSVLAVLTHAWLSQAR